MEQISKSLLVFIIAVIMGGISCNISTDKKSHENKSLDISSVNVDDQNTPNTFITDEESSNQALRWLWAKGASVTLKPGGISDNQGKSVVTDSKGYVYVIGDCFGATITFDEITSNITGEGWNTFFTKYDANGNVIWVKIIEQYDIPKIAIDASDNIYIGCSGQYISKYNCDGELIWRKNIFLSSISIAVQSSGNFYLMGSNNSNQSNKVIIRYNLSGEIVWTKDLTVINASGENGSCQIRNIATDNIGNIYITGDFDSQQIKLGKSSLYRQGLDYQPGWCSTNGFIIKCDDSGNVVWANVIAADGRPNLTYCNAVSVTKEEDVYVVGTSNGDLSIGTFNIAEGAFLIKYNKAGTVQWVKSIPNCGQLNHRISAITVNNYGNIYLCGWSGCKNISFDSFSETTEKGNLNFIVKYNANGDVLCTSKVEHLSSSQGKVTSECNCIIADKLGNVYVTGKYEKGEVKFGNSILSEPQRADYTFFLAKLTVTNQSNLSTGASNSTEVTSPYQRNRTVEESDILTYLISNNFTYLGNGLVTFTRNTVTVKGNGYTMIGDYTKISENSVRFNLRVVDGNFDASNNRTTYGVFVKNSDGTLTETLSDGKNTKTYTLTPE